MRYALIVLAGLVLCLLVHSLYLAHRVKQLQVDSVGLRARIEELDQEPQGATAPRRPEASVNAGVLDRAERMVAEARARHGVGRLSRADLLVAMLFRENTRLRAGEGDREIAEKLWKELITLQEQQFRMGKASMGALVDAHKQHPAEILSAKAKP